MIVAIYQIPFFHQTEPNIAFVQLQNLILALILIIVLLDAIYFLIQILRYISVMMIVKIQLILQKIQIFSHVTTNNILI